MHAVNPSWVAILWWADRVAKLIGYRAPVV